MYRRHTSTTHKPKSYNPGRRKAALTGAASAMIACAAVFPAQAQDKTLAAPTLSVTSTPGSEQAIEDVQASIEVIGREQLESEPGTTVAHVLQRAVGAFVSDGGTTSRFSIRGFEDGQALILVDGQRRRGRFGNTDMSNFNLDTVEQIEIIRGPMSALYGADAMAGVVNIVTRHGSRKPGARLQSLAGSYQDGQRATGIVRMSADTGQIGDTRHNVSASIRSRGAWSDEGSPYDDLKEDDNYFVAYDGVWDINNDHSLSLRLDYSQMDGDGLASNGAPVPSPVDSFEKQKDYGAALTWRGALAGGNIAVTGNAYRSEGQVLRTGILDETVIDGQEINGFYTFEPLGGHTVTFGLSALKEDVDVSFFKGVTGSREAYGAVAQDQWEFAPDWTLLAGVRYDDFSDFGDTTNPRVSLAFTPGPWTFRIGAGSAFKVPTYTQLYSTIKRGASTIYGNPNLRPETSHTGEGTIGYSFANGAETAITYHYSEVEDLITTRRTAPGRFDYVNIGQSRIQGIELTGRARLSETVGMHGSVEWLKAEDTQKNERLGRRPKYQAKLGIDWQALSGTTVYVNALGIGSYYAPIGYGASNVGNISTDYGRIDVKVAHDLTKNVQLVGGVDGLIGNEPPENLKPYDPADRFIYIGFNIGF